jgi:hypothetical protein
MSTHGYMDICVCADCSRARVRRGRRHRLRFGAIFDAAIALFIATSVLWLVFGRSASPAPHAFFASPTTPGARHMAETFEQHRQGLFGDKPPITEASHPDDPAHVKIRQDRAGGGRQRDDKGAPGGGDKGAPGGGDKGAGK